MIDNFVDLYSPTGHPSNDEKHIPDLKIPF